MADAVAARIYLGLPDVARCRRRKAKQKETAMVSGLTRALIVTAIAFGAAACTHTDRGATSASAGGSISSNDRQFVTMAAHASWAEVDTGQLAQKNGGSDAVRQFGARMVQDHGMANKELEAIAGKLGMTPPKEPDAKHQATSKMLSALNGAAFDKAYSAQMVKDHDMTIALFEKQSKGGENAELRQFAAKQLPILREHHKMAQSLPGNR
jgi:putative membrane protein